MPTINNPYSFDSPIGAALRNLQGVIMSGPNDAQRQYQAEAALKLKRENENVSALGDVYRRYGTPEFDRNTAMDLAIRGGYDPAKLANMDRYYTANVYGAKDPRTTNAFVGAGGAYSSSPAGFDATLAENQRQFDNMPYAVGSPTGPVVSTRRDAIGQPALESIDKVKGDFARRAVNSPTGLAGLNPTEQKFVGAAPANQTPRNYIAKNGQVFQTYDGITDARTGAALPPGMIASVQGTPEQSGLRPNVQGALQRADIVNQKFKKLITMTREAATNPMNFGVTGFVKGTLQDVGQLGQNVATGLGYQGINEALADTQKRAAAAGVSPALLSGVYDPQLNELHTLSDLMVFSAAEALANQQGRSVSDKDVKLFKDIVGDPREWLMSQEKYQAKLDTIERIVDAYQNVNTQNLRGGAPSAAAPAAPGAAAPPSPAQGAPGAPPAAERWERGPDGLPRRVQ